MIKIDIEQEDRPRGPLTPEEIREAFPDWREAVNEQIALYESEREALEDQTRLDLFCLPDLYPTENEREWARVFIEVNFEQETKQIDRELRRLRSLLPIKRHRRPNSGSISDLESARRVPCQEILTPFAKPTGTVNKWHCPFHDDEHPSFTISSKNHWKCWAGCGGGDVIELYMRLQNVNFVSAVRALAQRAA